MKNGIILYKSEYGATAKYAHWLREETSFDCISADNANLDDITEHDIIILCGGVYASRISGMSCIKRLVKDFPEKITILAVGASPYNQDTIKILAEKNITGNFKGIPLYYARGCWDESMLKFTDRLLCKMIRSSVENHPEKNDDLTRILMAETKDRHDWTDKKYLVPLLDYLQK